jgi:hypothetical protein
MFGLKIRYPSYQLSLKVFEDILSFCLMTLFNIQTEKNGMQVGPMLSFQKGIWSCS